MSDDLSRQVLDYAEFLVSTVDPVDFDEIRDRVADVDLQPLPPDRSRHRSGILIAVAAAVAIVVGVGAPALFLATEDAPTQDPPQRTEPSTATSVSTATGSTVPASSLQVAVDWIEVTEGAPPYNGPTDSPRTDFFVIDRGTTPLLGIVSGTDEGEPSLWTTEDGINWEQTPISLPGAEDAIGAIEVSSSGFWMSEGSILWHTSDLTTDWTMVDLELAPRPVYPLVGYPTIQDAVTVGEETLVAVQYAFQFDWDQLLGITPGTYDEYGYSYEGDEESAVERDPDQLDPAVTLVGRNWSETLDVSGNRIDEQWIEEPLLRFVAETSNGVLTLADADTGDTLFDFPGYGTFDWVDVVGPDAFPRFETEFSELLAVSEKQTQRVGPWQADLGSEPPTDSVQLFETSDGVLAVGEDGDVYRTGDGTSFQTVSVSSSIDGSAYDRASGYFYVPFVDPAYGSDLHWISADGVTWVPLDSIPVDYRGLQDTSTLSRVASGWLFIMSGADGRTSQYFSSDGEDWHPVAGRAPYRAGGLPASWGDRVLVVGDGSVWVGEIDLAVR